MFHTWLLSRASHATAGVLLSSSALLLVACSDETNAIQNNTNYEGLVTAVITKDGGRLEGDRGLAVEVPAGAVSQSVTIAGGPVDAVKAPPLPPEVTKLGLVFTLQPHGQTFQKPVSITIPFETTGPSMKLYTAQPQGTWSAVPGAAPQGTSLRAQVDHFSFYVVVSEDPCIQGGTSAPDGTVCGTDKVCKAGVCQPCQAGGACALGDGECKVGELSCATGEPRCVPSATNQADGTACGGGKVCNGGICQACEPGKACTDADFPCKEAALSCDSGKAVCEAKASDRANGTSCGNGLTCFNGACIECDAGATCTGANVCKQAKIACTTGQPICEETGTNAADGTACGSSQVCLGGACVACESGTTCTLDASPCKVAKLSCATGKPVCQATSDNVADGTSCGTDKVCGAGACNTCAQGASCTPANACHVGTTQCGSGAAVCEDTGVNAAAGTTCGSGQSCDETGACVKIDGVLSVVSGDKQSALPNQLLATPLVVRLAGPGNVPLANKTVKVTSTSGFASVDPAEATTNSQGRAVFQIRAGRQVGMYDFTVSATGAAPISASASATEPAPGTLIPLVNANLTFAFNTGGQSLTGLAANARIDELYGLAVAPDGTVYTATSKTIFRVSPQGQWEGIAGLIPGSGFISGSGPAKEAGFSSIVSMAVDAKANILYVMDGNILRAIDLTTGMIDVLGGQGSQGAPSYGDGGSAVAAQFPGSPSIEVAPNGLLYIRDGSERVRVYDPVTTVVNTWTQYGTKVGNATVCLPYSPPVFDGSGNAFLISDLVVDPATCSSGPTHLVKLTSATASALSGGGSPMVEGPSTQSSIWPNAGLAVDGAGSVFGVINYNGIYKIDLPSQALSFVMGDFQYDNGVIAGDFGPAKEAKTAVQQVDLDGAGHLYTIEKNSVRMVWKVGTPK